MISLINLLEAKATIDKKYINYVYLVLLLAVLRFVFVPLTELRSEFADELESVSLQVRTIDSLESAVSTYNERAIALDEVLTSYEKLLFKAPSVQTLQLDIQARLNKLLEKYQLEQKRVNWRSLPLKGEIKATQLSLTLDGRAAAFQSLVAEVESVEPKVVISSLFARSPSRGDKLSTTLTLTIYYKETK